MTAFDPDEIRTALDEADIRVLLMVLFHLTGEHRWLEPPFRPMRDIRLFADVSGGLSPELQAQVRDAVFDLLQAGLGAPRVGEPSTELLVEMMSAFNGEAVPAEYAPLVLEEMGFRRREAVAEAQAPAVPPDFRVLIIGAGMSGLLAAIKLQKLGIPFTVVEKNADVGGTWLENDYPDCRVDTPNHFYSYSFAPNHDWSRYFSPRDELYAYLRGCAADYQLRPHIRFDTRVEAATWDETAQRWQVALRDADGNRTTCSANAVITAVGLLNRPQMPDIPGLNDFAGPLFHSARWPRDIDLSGKRVAVIGTGASAMQLVPRVAEQAAQLTVFQRSPQWAKPSQDYHRSVGPGTRWLLHNLPFYAAWYRFGLFWRFGDGLHRSLQIDPDWPHPERSLNRRNERHRRELEEYIREQLDHDPELIAKAMPDYPPFGKRILVDNGWFQTLRRDNVELVTDPIQRLTARGVVTGDVEHPFDVVVIATGFHAADILGDIDIRGRDGVRLADQWQGDNPRAYLGMTAPGFPNLFFLYGPNTNLGHGGSIIFQAECQVRYVTACLAALLERGAGSMECRQDVHDTYNAEVDAAHEKMIWTHPAMTTYYRNRAGRVVTNSPWRMVDYWWMTREPDLEDYLLHQFAR